MRRSYMCIRIHACLASAGGVIDVERPFHFFKFLFRKWKNQDLAHSPLERTGQATSDQVTWSAAGLVRGLVGPGSERDKGTVKLIAG